MVYELDEEKFKYFVSMEDIAGVRSHISEKVVMTNGCFDLLHPGHIHSLKEARKLGNCLIVVLNSDSSVKKLKGPKRPIFNEIERSTMLTAISFVDFVVLCDDDNMCNALQQIKPDIWVKGSDRTLETLNQDERRIAEENEIEIKFIPNKQGVSTTNTIDRIISCYSDGGL